MAAMRRRPKFHERPCSSLLTFSQPCQRSHLPRTLTQALASAWLPNQKAAGVATGRKYRRRLKCCGLPSEQHLRVRNPKLYFNVVPNACDLSDTYCQRGSLENRYVLNVDQFAISLEMLRQSTPPLSRTPGVRDERTASLSQDRIRGT